MASAAAVALFAAGCGDDDEPATTAASESGTDLAAIKDCLMEHSAALAEQTEILREQAERYYEIAEAANSTTRRS